VPYLDDQPDMSASTNSAEQDPSLVQEPLGLLQCWLDDATDAGLQSHTAMTLCTASADGEPSARTVDIKRLEPGTLIFTTALWTRKAREMTANPKVAGLFHWPQLGRQVHVAGTAVLAERALAEELFALRNRTHRLQTLVSRQGETIGDLAPLHKRLLELEETYRTAEIPCPEDWGAFRLTPCVVEFWEVAPDRLHERILFERTGVSWQRRRLAP
jgi:pyridoxamine 5'-phosphate oxidase